MAKFTVQMDDKMTSMLENIAAKRGIPKTQVLRNAVALLKYLDDASEKKDVVLRDKADPKKEDTVIFAP